MRDVLITLPPVGKTFSVVFERRTRKGFRDELLKLGSETRVENHFNNFPMSSLDRVKELISETYPTWTVDVRDNTARIKHEGDRIKWADVWTGNAYGVSTRHYGYVGNQRLFEVQRAITSTKFETKKYYLEWEISSIPLHEKSDDPDELEKIAEQYLRMFVKSLGATFES